MTTITYNTLSEDEKKLCLNTLTDEQRVPRKCLKCKKTKNPEQFIRIITRKNWGINSDDNGFEHGYKMTMACLDCRIPHAAKMRARYEIDREVKLYKSKHLPRNGQLTW